MLKTEARAVPRLVGTGAAQATEIVRDTHLAVASRAFGTVGLPAAVPRAVHNGISRLVYASVRGAFVAGGIAAGAAAGAAATRWGSGRALTSDRRAHRALSILNGAVGDKLAGPMAPLALPLAVRVDGRDVDITPDGLEAAFPDATDSLVVFAHGLIENEDWWHWGAEETYGDPSVTYGSQLRRDLGMTPVYLRYNTGLPVGRNGADLAWLLDDLVAAWPVPVRSIALVGHSMGGLVVRAAFHAAAHRGSHTDWPSVVRSTVTLGAPHVGSPVAQGAHALATALAKMPETAGLGKIIVRSEGIYDMTHGTICRGDFGCTHDDDVRRSVPLQDGPRHHAVVGTIATRHDSLLGELVGDLLVRPSSAVGDSRDESRLAFGTEDICRLGGLHHFDLLNSPKVYERLLAWLRADVSQPAAVPG